MQQIIIIQIVIYVAATGNLGLYACSVCSDGSAALDAPPPTTPADTKRPETNPEAALAITEKTSTDEVGSAEQTDNLVPQEIPSATGMGAYILI